MSKLCSIVIATVILGIAWLCQKEEYLSPERDKLNSELLNEGLTMLGEQRENPY